MSVDMKNELFAFFAGEKENVLRDWEKLIIISDNDPFQKKIMVNGAMLFDVVMSNFKLNKDELLQFIQNLANEISAERVIANINIGDFVYNVNVGRSVIYSYLGKAGLEWVNLQEAINSINFCFDQFLFFAVTHYTAEKNKIIDEKTKFIDSTHKDRLTLLGQMTSSFIHEFRNPLTSIQGFIQLLKSDYPDMKYLDIISNELGQLNFRISQFLLLSKKELIGKEKSEFCLNQLIEEVLNFLYPSILDGNVKILNHLGSEQHIMGYADEIRQVMINIIFNAIDVLGQHRTPLPTVKITSHISEDGCICITITNNGPMIPEHYRKTIFEPFFTTKKLGTGLGLYVCKEIIERHKGEISCHSTEEETSFVINLPLVEPE